MKYGSKQLGQLVPGTVDFANIFFGGPCNRSCPWCIGKRLPSAVNVNNLDSFPPANIEGLIDGVIKLGIKQVVFSGTVTDPQLYNHEARLLGLLRQSLDEDVTYSLHTNGVLALRKMETFNLYDKVCIAFPSFNSATYRKLMGSSYVPDLARIVERSRVPVKVSCLVNEHNFEEIDEFLDDCRKIGVKRVVLRTLVGDTRKWPLLCNIPHVRRYRGNPVYDLDGLEVTRWNYEASESKSINLFPNGVLGTSYLLTETEQFKPREPRAFVVFPEADSAYL